MSWVLDPEPKPAAPRRETVDVPGHGPVNFEFGAGIDPTELEAVKRKVLSGEIQVPSAAPEAPAPSRSRFVLDPPEKEKSLVSRATETLSHFVPRNLAQGFSQVGKDIAGLPKALREGAENINAALLNPPRNPIVAADEYLQEQFPEASATVTRALTGILPDTRAAAESIRTVPEESRRLSETLQPVFGRAGEAIAPYVAGGRAALGAPFAMVTPKVLGETMGPALEAVKEGATKAAATVLPDPVARVVGEFAPDIGMIAGGGLLHRSMRRPRSSPAEFIEQAGKGLETLPGLGATEAAALERIARASSDAHLQSALSRLRENDPRYPIYQQEILRREGASVEPRPAAESAVSGEVRRLTPPEAKAKARERVQAKQQAAAEPKFVDTIKEEVKGAELPKEAPFVLDEPRSSVPAEKPSYADRVKEADEAAQAKVQQILTKPRRTDQQSVKAAADEHIRTIVDTPADLEYKGKTYTGAVKEGNNVLLKDTPDKLVRGVKEILTIEEKVPFDIPPETPEPVFTSSKEPPEVSQEVIKRGKEFLDEQTPAGIQTLIPGAEARSVPDAPLRPKRAQTEKPLDLEQPGLREKEPELIDRPIPSTNLSAEEIAAANEMRGLLGGKPADAITAKAQEAATSPTNDLPPPTEKQIEAGNYKKGHVAWNGFDVSIENPRGSIRSGKDANGQPWEVTMPAHYGYIRRTNGADGDHVDIYLAETPSRTVFVVDQIDANTGKWDEHKVIGNVGSRAEAEQLYDAGFSDGRGPERRGAITEMSLEQFKDWIENGDTKNPVGTLPGAAMRQRELNRHAAKAKARERVEAAAKGKKDLLNKEPPGGWTDADKVPRGENAARIRQINKRLKEINQGREVAIDVAINDKGASLRRLEAEEAALLAERKKLEAQGSELIAERERLTTDRGAVLPDQATKLKIGDQTRVMGVDSLLSNQETIGGVRYEIYSGERLREDRAAIRVVDEDSGNVVSLTQYPNYDAADAAFKTALEKARATSDTPLDTPPAEAQISTSSEVPDGTRQPSQNPPGVDVRESTGARETTSPGGEARGTSGGEVSAGAGTDRSAQAGEGTDRGRGVRDSEQPTARATGRAGDERQPTAAATARGAETDLREAGRERTRQPAQERQAAADVNHVLPKDEDWIPAGTKSKVTANLDAIDLLKRLEAEDRAATPEEKALLSKYVGWGGLKEVFDEGKAAYRQRPGRTPEQITEAAHFEKNWGKLYDEVKARLTPEERAAAGKSILNAHYTSREIINGIWSAVNRLGFKGGNALEPAAGIGHFIGLTPDELGGATRWRASELDNISARIAAKLYPQARVENIGFENSKVPLNSQDLVITNVPFDSAGPKTKNNPENLNLHNFFIVRGLELTKPGRLMAVITSDTTMDNPGAGAKAREMMAEKADLVAAIRLPNNAFKKNAGTEVTTDILFFRKKDGTAFEGESFRRVVESETYKGEPVQINEYFVKHPEMMLGRMSIEGTMRREGMNTLLPIPGKNLTDQLSEAIAKLPENIVGSERFTAVDEPRYESVDQSQKVGALRLTGTGEIRQVSPDRTLLTPEWASTPAKAAQAKRYIHVRDTATKLIDLQLSPDATDQQIEAARAELNKLYDDYVKKHGPINKRSSAYLEDDVDFPLALALEDGITTLVETKRGGKTVATRQTEWIKSKIFSERTLFPREAPTQVDTVTDGVQVSMNYRGRVEPEYIAELTGKNAEAVGAELEDSGTAFQNPQTGLWETRAEYLSGFVKDKLTEAKAAAEDDPRFQRHVAELEKVQPAPIAIENISLKLGSRWIPPPTIQQFIKETLDVDADVSLTTQTGHWHIKSRGNTFSEANQTVHGIHNIAGHKLVELALNLKGPKVEKYIGNDEHGNPKYEKDGPKTLEAEAKQADLQKLFKDWARKDPNVARNLETIYNEQFNGVTARRYEPPTWAHYPGASTDIALREHQKAVVSRMLQNGTLLAHAVGTGKTYAMVTAAMEMRRLGLAKKPMIVVQNATLEQFARSFKRLYPTSKVLSPTAKMRDAQNRNKTMSRIATGDWDSVIIPQSFMNMLPDDLGRQMEYIESRLNELRRAKIDAAAAEGKRSPKASDLQRAINALEARLEKLADRKKDNVLTFEKLGVDALFIDEAHAYKKLEFTTQMENIKGLDKSYSQRGFSMMMKARWVQEKNQGKNVIFATGTPVSNTLAEAWNMMRYVRPDVLTKYGMEDFDSFGSTFGDTINELEMTAGGTWKPVTRFARFTNGPELIQAWRTVADVVTPEEINLPGLPSVKGGGPQHVSVKQTEAIKNYIAHLRERLEEFAAMSGREKRENSHIPLVVFGLAKKASLDMRMIDPRMPDEPGSKLNRAANEVMRVYKESGAVKGTQMVFADSFQNDPENPQFNLYDEMKKKLVQRGIPEEEIVIITEKIKDARREALFEKFNAGEIRVVIGSTERMGVGVNAQERLIALHHLDAPPRPMDIEQRNGRIIRQGNQNPEVEVLNYGVENTLDAAMYQKLATKQKFINQILRGDIDGRFFEDPANEQSLTFEEQMAAFSGDKRAMEKVGLENQIRQIEGLQKGHIEQVRKARETLQDLNTRIIPATQRLLANSDRLAVEFSETFPLGFEPELQVNGKTIKGKKEVTAALDGYFKNAIAEVVDQAKAKKRFGDIETENVHELTLNGKPILTKVYIPQDKNGVADIERGSVQWRFQGPDVAPGAVRSGQGFFTSLTNQLEQIERAPKRMREDLAGRERSQRELASFIEKPFERDAEIEAYRTRLSELTAELEAEGKAAPADEAIGDVLPSEAPPRPEPQAPPPPDPTNLDAVSARNQQEVRANRKAEGQSGQILLRRGTTQPTTNATTGQDYVDRALSTTAKRSFIEGIKDVSERFMRVFEYEREVADNPLFVDDLRLFQGERTRAFAEAAKDVDGIVGNLRNGRELQHFSGIVQLRDMISRLESGQKVQDGITLVEAQAGLQTLMEAAPQHILDAVERHFTLVRAVGEEKVARGWMAADALRDDYFRHKVLQYERKGGVGKPSRIRPPAKEKMAKGSKLAIERDYLKVTYEYLAEHRFKKALDDFVNAQAEKLDRSAEVRAAMGPEFKLRPGQIVEIDGRKIKGFQFDQGNQIFPEISIRDRAINETLANGLGELGIPVDELEAVSAGQQGEILRRGLAIGRKKPTYALDVNVANRLEKFSGPQVDSDFIAALNKLTGKWKGLTINFGGTAFQLMNFMGDIGNISRADIASPLYMPKAARMLLRNTDDARLLTRLAEELEVINSGFVGSEVNRLLATPEFNRFMPAGKQVLTAPARAADKLLTVSNYRENLPRLALFLKNAARLQGGLPELIERLRQVPEGERLLPAAEELQIIEQLKTGEIDVEGLSPIRGAAKVAREIPVDYQKFTPDENRFLRGLFLPFYAWTKQNTIGWTKYAAKNPGKFTALVLVPWAIMEAWNNTMYPDEEDGLKDYLRNRPHLITGIKDARGRDIVIDFGAMPASSAMENLGIGAVPSRISSLMRSKLTLTAAARKTLTEVATGPGKAALNLITPFLKIPYEIARNENTLTGVPVVPRRKEGTDEALKLQGRYAMEGLFRPAREARSLVEQVQQGTYDFASSRFGLGLPLRRSAGEGHLEDVYERYRAAEQAKKTWDLYKREGKTKQASEYLRENRQLIAEERALAPVLKTFGLLGQRAERIRNSDKPAEVKIRELDAINKRRNSIAARVLKNKTARTARPEQNENQAVNE